MSKLHSLSLVCIWYFVAGTNAAAVSFIDKCSWDDKACLKTSSQKAIPFVAAGLPQYGMPPLDPLNLHTITISEGGLDLVLKDVSVTGPKHCEVVDVERNIQENWLKFAVECPIDATGNYVASGQLVGIPIEGNGPIHVKSDKVLLAVKIDLQQVDGKDGQKHWSLSKYESTYDFKLKTLIDLQNLYNGDQEKAAPIQAILDSNWKSLLDTFGKPIINKFIDDVVGVVKKFTDNVPASELEL